MPVSRNFYQVVSDAVADVAEHGFDSQERVDRWVAEIRAAAVRSMIPEYALAGRLREGLRAVYRKWVERGAILRHHPGVSAFKLQMIAPRLHAELDRRVHTSADLIRLNRAEAVEATLRRFRGWTSSVPPGGSRVTDKTDEAAAVRKAMASLPFEERRVAIDQAHKLFASISSVVATDNGAIAGEWVSHKYQAGYDSRPEHDARHGKIYLFRDSWARDAGFVKPGPAGYADEIDQPAEAVYCRCFWRYIYALRRMPEDMLTAKGKMELNRTREMAA